MFQTNHKRSKPIICFHKLCPPIVDHIESSCLTILSQEGIEVSILRKDKIRCILERKVQVFNTQVPELNLRNPADSIYVFQPFDNQLALSFAIQFEETIHLLTISEDSQPKVHNLFALRPQTLTFTSCHYLKEQLTIFLISSDGLISILNCIDMEGMIVEEICSLVEVYRGYLKVREGHLFVVVLGLLAV